MSKLREYRERIGLTQEQFGRDVGAKKATICRLENGERTPSSALADRILEKADGELTLKDLLEPAKRKGVAA